MLWANHLCNLGRSCCGLLGRFHGSFLGHFHGHHVVKNGKATILSSTFEISMCMCGARVCVCVWHCVCVCVCVCDSVCVCVGLCVCVIVCVCVCVCIADLRAFRQVSGRRWVINCCMRVCIEWLTVACVFASSDGALQRVHVQMRLSFACLAWMCRCEFCFKTYTKRAWQRSEGNFVS